MGRELSGMPGGAEASPRPAPWLVYALGGGHGHLHRAVALARAACRRGHRVTVLTNSPFAPLVAERAAVSGMTLCALDHRLDRDAIAARVRARLDGVAWSTLVVDTFPRGLGGELASSLPRFWGLRVLVHRDLQHRYVEACDLHTWAGHYDLVLLPGERGPLAEQPGACSTAPWLLRDHDELLGLDAARRELRLDPDDRAPVVAVVGSGTPAEVDEMAGVATRLHASLGGAATVRFASLAGPPAADPVVTVRPWPLLAVLAAVDVLVASGGYSVVHEARATRTMLLGLARDRLYDRQASRLHAGETVATVDQIIARLRALPDEPPPLQETPMPGPFDNGVHDAVGAIERWLARASRRRPAAAPVRSSFGTTFPPP